MAMKGKMVAFAAVALVVVVMAVAVERGEAAITCTMVTQKMAGCVGYLQSGAGKPTANCCAGVKSLAQSATTTQDRRTACGCLKQASSAVPNVKPNAVSSLPASCGVSLPFKISLNTNCNTIN
ncbi:non-specific lipid-transfer protein 1 isoform X2 [Cryptomeria japonica]|uniref:non-specific lipid-transfer protein 1 isoform X2 n=1 Tax=Cryptomeria japonica TaxID=3369 RepID=UPI0025ABAB22|nr:non-specific lipid-transfer protein 1 isoform X2 [Cryptomeria japonica]